MNRAKSFARRSYNSMKAWGIDPRLTVGRAKSLSRVHADRKKVVEQKAKSADSALFPLGRAFVVTGEWTDEGGVASGHYFHQDLVVARDIYLSNPRRHIDVGSRVDGFVAHVAAFREIEVMDVRRINAKVSGIVFHQQDLMSLDPEWKESADSVSCLHALEHFGLGRYGDPIDFDGWRLGLENLQELLIPGGTLYLSVPTGVQQRIEFNAHRVFSIPFLRQVLSESMNIQNVDFVLDSGELVSGIDLDSIDGLNSFGAEYGCSIWKLKKPE
jgi:hypothetical protein